MKNLRTPALRKGLLPAAILAAVAPVAAFAQDSAASGTTELDRIQVTGSRIRQASLETAQPVILMQREDIEKQGFVSVADIIQNISTTGSPALSRADALASGENVGGQYVDLRNLGPQRTLVLLDGKRMGITSDGYSDLASIPTSVVERVEVLTDGASAIYGSDAIAGVINIITRRNFDGFEASAYYGQYGQGDGAKESYNFLVGTTGERSSFTLGGEFSKEDPVLAADRNFSAFPNGPYHPVPDIDPATGRPRTNGWSAATNQGILYVGDDAFTLNPGGDPRNLADYSPTNPLTNYTNPSQEMFLQTGLERRSVFANGAFDFSDNLRLRGDFLYTHRETEQQIAGYPFQNYAFDDTVLSAGSYFNPTGVDSDFIRRTSEVPRRTIRELTTYRFSGGLEGAFEIGEKFWDWDIGYVYNQNKGTVTGTGDLFLPNVRAALGPSFMDTDGVVKCGAPGAVVAGCTPWNPLAPMGQGYSNTLADPNLQRFLLLPTHDTSETTTQIFSANIGGVLATLPAGDLGMAVGIEHRKEEARYEPDALLQSGLTTSLAGGPTQGGYSLNEIYAEFQVPLLADVPFAQELSLDVAGRYSDYDTFGDTTNGKVGLKWKPIEDVLVRGTYATGFRAPTVGDLFGGTSQTFDFYTDPCDTLFGAAIRNPSVAAACAAGGLPADFRQIASGNVEATGPGSQSAVPYLSGSNPELQPEESKTWTLGVVYSPNFIEGLDVSVDWWKIRINDVIAAESVTSILNQCYVLGIDSACGRFVRDPDDGQVVDVTRSLINGGYQETAGYDVGIRYRLPETAVGAFTFDWKTTYVDYLEYKRDNEAETPIEQSTGWGASFRVRSNLNADWAINDQIGINWAVRYYSSMKESCTYDLNGGPECNIPDFSSSYTLEQPSHKLGSNTFHDVQFRYNAPWDATISLGANNVFDHQGPIMYSQPNSNFPYYGGFDIGRFVYMKYQQRF